MAVIYVDSVFLLNGTVDYLLLLLTARFAGLRLRRWRYGAAGLLGGVYAVAAFLPRCGFLTLLPAKLACGILMLLIAYGGEGRFLRLCGLFFGMSCAFAGGVLGLGLLAGHTIPQSQGIFYTNVDGKIFVLTATVAYLLITLIFRAAAESGLRGQRLPVTLCAGGRQQRCTALWDSGNGLKDWHGEPVLVVERSVLEGMIPRVVMGILGKNAPASQLLVDLQKAAPWLCPQLLPYSSVGQAGGLLLSLRIEWGEIGGKRYPNLRIAVSPNPLGDGFQALWGGEQGRSIVYEHLAQTDGLAEEDFSDRHSLHWRK